MFDKEHITLGDRTEASVRGGRHLFERLPRAFQGVSQIGVIGWGPQGSAQACNLRDSVAGAVRVSVGLRACSPSFQTARAAGFSEADGTLGAMYDVIARSELVILLIADAAMAEVHEQVFAAVRPGTTLGLSHGFLLGHLVGLGQRFPTDVDGIAVCPKGMVKSVHALYVQGRGTNGAGINARRLPRLPMGKIDQADMWWSVRRSAPIESRLTSHSTHSPPACSAA